MKVTELSVWFWIGLGLLVAYFPGEFVNGAIARNVDKAQAEAIAAAAESAAAEADDLAAAIEISESEPQGSGASGSQQSQSDSFESYSSYGHGGSSGSQRGGGISSSGTNQKMTSGSKFQQGSSGYGANFDDTNDGGEGIADVETPLHTLLTDSSDLAKEVRTLFEVLSRRENYLIQEMEKLRDALQHAIDALVSNERKYRI